MRRKCLGVALTFACLTTLQACVGENQAAPQPSSNGDVTKGGDDRTGQYDVVDNWWKAAPNHDAEWGWGQVAGVAVDTPDRIIAVTRATGQRTARYRGRGDCVAATSSWSRTETATSSSSGASGTRS